MFSLDSAKVQESGNTKKYRTLLKAIQKTSNSSLRDSDNPFSVSTQKPVFQVFLQIPSQAALHREIWMIFVYTRQKIQLSYILPVMELWGVCQRTCGARGPQAGILCTERFLSRNILINYEIYILPISATEKRYPVINALQEL